MKLENVVYTRQMFESLKKGVRFNYVNYNRPICPACKGFLIVRQGKFGAFEGCTNFPDCRYARSIK